MLFYSRALFTSVLFLGLFISVNSLSAQQIRLEPASVQESLEQIRADLGVDIVFGERLVAGRSHDCSYRGSNLMNALECVLSSSGLNARKLSSRQVLVFADPKESHTAVELDFTVYEGKVLDHETNLAIAGAHILQRELKLGAITDSKGRFKFELPLDSDLSVSISHIGYRKSKQNLSDLNNFKLKPASFSGIEVIVDAAHRTEELSTFEIARAELDLMNDPRSESSAFSSNGFVFQPVQWLPGIRRTGEVGGNLLVRGGLPDQNQFLLDGAPVYQPWHAQGLVSILEPSSIKSLDIYDAVIPARYGGRLSSVVDAKLKSPSSYDYSGSASMGSFSTSLNVGGPISRLGRFSIGGRVSHAGLPGSSLPDTRRTALMDVSFYDVFSRYELDINRNRRVSATLYLAGDNLSSSGQEFSMLEYLNGQVFQQSDSGWNTKLLSLTDRQILGTKTLLNTTIYASSYQAFDGSLSSADSDLGSESKDDLDMSPNVGVSDIGLNWDWSTWLGDSHEDEFGLSLGYQNYYWLDRVFGARLENQYRREASVYGQDVWSLGEAWEIMSGLRLSYQSAVERIAILPRGEIKFTPLGKKLQASLGYSRQVQYNQRVIEESALGAGYAMNNWIPSGKGFLDPAFSEDLHFKIFSGYKDRLTFSADAYWRKMTNVLVGQSERSLGLDLGTSFIDRSIPFISTLPFSPGNLRSYGTEFSMLFAKPGLNSWISYTYSSSMINEQGSERWIASPYHAPHLLKGAFTKNLGSLSLTLAGQYSSAYPFSAWSVDVNYQAMPSYFRLDGGLGYDFAISKYQANLQVQIYNLTGNDNLIAQSVLVNGVPSVQKKEGIGLWPNLKFTFDF